MSGLFPSIAPSDVTLRSVSPSRMSMSHSQKRQIRTRASQRWSISLSYPIMKVDDYARIQGFLAAQRGQFETFQIVVAGYTAPRGTWGGTPVVAGGSQTGLTLNLSGFTANITGIVKAGDIFKTANISKVYMVTEDANSSGAGLVTVLINTPLHASPANLEAITKTDVQFTVASTSDSFEMGLKPAFIGQVAGLELIEIF